MKSRIREFNDTRNKNLSQIQSNRSNTDSHQNSFYHNKEANNHSFTSSFLKKSKPDVCVSCVNKKIINHKKQQDGKEKQQIVQQAKTQMQKLNSRKDPNEQYRQKLKKETNEYNKTLIMTRLASSKSFKQNFDTKYLKQQEEQNNKTLEQEKKHLLYEQAQRLQYKKDLFVQYKQEQQKKTKNRLQKHHEQTVSLPIKESDNIKIVKQYQKDLKKQMNQDRIRKQTERQKQLQNEKKLAELSQKQFFKYTQFTKKQPSNINPQVFEQLSLIDYSKKIQKVEQRQRKTKERLEQLEREQQIAKSQLEKNAKMKRQYESDLKNQITQKTSRLVLQKQRDLQLQQSFYKYSEEIANESKILKPCDQCSNKFEEKCLI